MTRPALSILALLTAATLAACASNDDRSASGEDNQTIAQRKLVSGYDLEGPKALPTSNGPQACPRMITPEQTACSEAGGDTLIAADCKDLCSVPIAGPGQVAGFDFEGFKVVSDNLVTATLCAQMISPVDIACGLAGGTARPVNDCGLLCSVPVAPEGSVAGFDLEGAKILPQQKSGQACAEVVSPVQERCSLVGGKTIHAADCADLCSLPL